jgi:hypothetical protein
MGNFDLWRFDGDIKNTPLTRVVRPKLPVFQSV